MLAAALALTFVLDLVKVPVFARLGFPKAMTKPELSALFLHILPSNQT
jgi:hypothetical protein